MSPWTLPHAATAPHDGRGMSGQSDRRGARGAAAVGGAELVDADGEGGLRGAEVGGLVGGGVGGGRRVAVSVRTTVAPSRMSIS